MKKLTYLMATALISIITLTGCATGGADKTTNGSDNTEVVTDNNTEVENETTEPDNKEVVIEHTMGTVTVPVNPDKVVVFDYGVLDTIDALNLKPTLGVSVESLPAYLSEYSDSTNVGSLKEPDLEAIFDFEPEVIFISGRQASYYDQLSEIAPTVYVELNATSYMEDFKKNVGFIAKIFEVEEAANEKLAIIEQQAAEVNAIAQTKEEKALILLTNDGNISVYGKGSRFGIIHDLLGVKAADENIESSTHGQEANYEYISHVNPDIMFVVDRTVVGGGTITANTVLDNDLVNGTNAAMNNKIVSLDPDIWYLSGGGIKSVEEMIRVVGEAINK